MYAFQHAEGVNRDELLRLYSQEELDEEDVNRVLDILDDLGADRQTDELTDATAEEGRIALAMLELPPWATEDAKNLIDFMAYRLF